MDYVILKKTSSLPGCPHHHMKLNSTIPIRKGIFRDTIPGIGLFRNLKFQAPNSN
jgi:hypothetical protein